MKSIITALVLGVFITAHAAPPKGGATLDAYCSGVYDQLACILRRDGDAKGYLKYFDKARRLSKRAEDHLPGHDLFLYALDGQESIIYAERGSVELVEELERCQ